MNEVYKSETMIVHDDRDFITAKEAHERLHKGETIHLCDPPNYGAENEHEIFSASYEYRLSDIPEKYHAWPAMEEYLRGYEISK